MGPQDAVSVGTYRVGGGNPLLWICGPCVIESHDLTMRIAETLKGYADRLGLPLVFKASFDKANRSSGKSFRGPGIHEGLKTLEAVKRAHRVAGHHRHPRVRAGGPGRGGVRHPASPGVPRPPDRFTGSVRQNRQSGEREEGTIHGPVGHEERGR